MLLCPVQSPARITQHFGANPQAYRQFGTKGHTGIDLTGPKKGELVTVYAPYDAEVYEVGDQGKGGYGRYVRLRTAPNRAGVRKEIILGHLSKITAKPGSEVNLGDPLGVMGSTGFSSAPHVHLGLRRIGADGQVIDRENGFNGYVDLEPYMIFWGDPKALGLVSYPNG